MLETIQMLRKNLHQYPDLSGKEANTAQIIRQFIALHHPGQFFDAVGGNGLAVVYEFSGKGPAIMIRCELDALPIDETNVFEHRSLHQGVAHKCGHDGHMAIVAGLVFWLKCTVFQLGKIILLFQAAEETGDGARCLLADDRFRNFCPDYVFSLHNIPGEPIGSVIMVPGSFSATVQSMAIYLSGKACHAAEPGNGINPALAIADIIRAFEAMGVKDTDSPQFSMVTPVHLKMGTKAYGISPGEAALHYTLRTWSVEAMESLKSNLKNCLISVCDRYQLSHRIEWVEYFPATRNDAHCNQLIRNAAERNGLALIEKKHPYTFGEDFGWFSQTYTSAMFGLGAGTNLPALHHADYDFPDAIIGPGIAMFTAIAEQILTSELP